MFAVNAKTIDEYLGFDPNREADLRRVDEVMRSAAPLLPRWLVRGTPPGRAGMSMTMLGYGTFEYAVTSSPDTVKWPIVGLALQKNHLSLYLSAKRGPNQTPFAHDYAGRLGGVDVSSTGVVRFGSAGDLDVDGLTAMLSDLQRGLADGTIRVRYRSTTTTVDVEGFPLAMD